MSKLCDTYREWILEQRTDGYSIVEDSQGNILIEGDLVKGWVNFYDIEGTEIVELRLERTMDGDTEFFLHFELVSLERAQELYNEMASVLYDLIHPQVRKVLICCSVGMTSTFFSIKLNEEAERIGLGYEFSAMSIEEAKRKGNDYAAVLLAPQVGHLRSQAASELPNTPVIEIPSKIFGTYDVNAALRLVTDALSGAREASGDLDLQLRRPFDKTKRVLAISYVHREDEPTLCYRVFDHGDVADAGMLVRRSVSIRTLNDLAATLRVRGWRMDEFDAIGVAVPGVVVDGVIVERFDGTEVHDDFRKRLEELWKTTVYVDYNATAAAVGCYVTQDEYENVAFHAQAIGVPEGEEGYVVEGKPLVGCSGRSGHLGPLAKSFMLNMDARDASWRVNGMCELVARYVASLACTIAPEVVYVWCDLVPDMEELREELLKALPANAVPQLRAVADYDGCVLMGTMALCLQRLAQTE